MTKAKTKERPFKNGDVVVWRSPTSWSGSRWIWGRVRRVTLAGTVICNAVGSAETVQFRRGKHGEMSRGMRHATTEEIAQRTWRARRPSSILISFRSGFDGGDRFTVADVDLTEFNLTRVIDDLTALQKWLREKP